METKKPSVPTAPTEIEQYDLATPDCEFQSRSHSRRGNRTRSPYLTRIGSVYLFRPARRQSLS